VYDEVLLSSKPKNILDNKNIALETFSRVYDEVLLSSKPQNILV
jgi:hypothetical protein